VIPLFKIRSSATGDIMGGNVGLSDVQKRKLQGFQKKMQEGKKLTELQAIENDKLVDLENKPSLPSGAKSYCRTWLTEKLYNRRKNFTSKFTDKGNICEDNSIEFLSDYFLLDLSKNEEYFEGDFITGTPDLIVGESEVWDIKNSWSPDTFPIFDTKPNIGYWWQLQSYMALTGRSKARLV